MYSLLRGSLYLALILASVRLTPIPHLSCVSSTVHKQSCLDNLMVLVERIRGNAD